MNVADRLTAMTFARLTVVVLLLVSLAGCASQPDPTVTACDAFAKLNNHWAHVERDTHMSPADRLDFRHGYRGMMHAIALKASGDVKTRLTALVSAMPADATDLLLNTGNAAFAAYVSNAGRVADACKAAGTPITLYYVLR